MSRNAWWAGLERPISWCQNCPNRRARYSHKDNKTLCAECRANIRQGGMAMKAYRVWKQNPLTIFYVAELKGKVGGWGYTSDPAKAITLSPYWQKRFAADCRAVGSEAKFI